MLPSKGSLWMSGTDTHPDAPEAGGLGPTRGSLLTCPPASPGDVNVVQPNYPAAARDFLRAFRSGALGPVMLDRDILQGVPSVEP